MHRGSAHAGTGTDRRRAGPDGAHHQARQGEPGLRSARARRDSRRRPVRTGAGWSTSPTCRPGTGFLVAPPSSRGLCATAASSAGPPARARGTGARPAPWNRRPGARKHRDGGDPWGLVHHSDHGSKSPVHRLHRATRRRGHRSPRPKPWAPPCAGAAAQALGKPPASAGPVLARRPLEGPRRPPGPQPPAG